jgi:hypothetical protein
LYTDKAGLKTEQLDFAHALWSSKGDRDSMKVDVGLFNELVKIVVE